MELPTLCQLNEWEASFMGRKPFEGLQLPRLKMGNMCLPTTDNDPTSPFDYAKAQKSLIMRWNMASIILIALPAERVRGNVRKGLYSGNVERIHTNGIRKSL